MKRTIFIVVAALFSTFYLQAQFEPQPIAANTVVKQEDNTYVLNQRTYSVTDPTSIWVLVNKDNPISLDFVPNDLRDVAVPKRRNISASEQQLRSEVASKTEELFAAADDNGTPLELSSAYRSSYLQTLAYEGYVRVFGQEKADTFSAAPGTSEHQTGLAVDVSAEGDEDCYIEACFGDSAAGLWIEQHAHLYGFIIRYPKDKEAITGYNYEPWHLRYVGTDLAFVIHDQQTTLEQVFDL